MMIDLHGIPHHPADRDDPFDPPPLLRTMLRSGPITPLRYPDGHVGWLITGYDLARQVLSDPRFSARSEFKRSPVSRPGADPFYGQPASPGWLVDMDAPQHTRIRRALAKHFTAQRMRNLEPRVREVVDDHLSGMRSAGSPTDLVRSFALPVPSLVICELLGVPYEERAEFQRHSAVLFGLDSSADQASRAMTALNELLRALIERRRKHSATDLLGSLTMAGTLSRDELVGIGVLLLTAGHETTANSLSLGTFALLQHPEQLAALRANTTLIDNTVDELLRYLSIFHFGVPRTPTEDVTIDRQTIRAGQSVTVSLPAANRDPRRFPHGHRLDINQPARGHVAFGFGLHQCIGQNLARIELRTGLLAMFTAFPKLSLAIPPEEVRMHTNMGVYGVYELPVQW
jgi:cytochrome P450